MKLNRRFIAAAIYILMSAAGIFAETVEFYATVSSSSDAGMIKMSTDLLFTQLQSMDGYTVIDRRNENYNPENKSGNISFYTDIQEESSGKWTCTLNAFKNEAAFSSTKEYDSYYKILMDAKASLENFMLNLSGNIAIPEQDSAVAENSTGSTEEKTESAAEKKRNPVMDLLAGTWTGEDLIEKILLLKGGRGFIVFKNGASMNVSVSVSGSGSTEGSDITIRQNGKPNASFYPDLPRQEALKIAATAKPIEWVLKLNGDTLSGIKKTLVPDKKSSTGISEGTVNVSWTKQH